MNLKKIVLVLCVIFVFISVYSQTNSYSYYYDQSGNRIRRELIIITNPENFSTNTIDTNKINSNEVISNDFNNINIAIYPNPTSENLTIEMTNMPDELKGLIVISDLQGRILYQTTQVKQKTIIDFSKYTYGNYILQITVNDIKREWNVLKQ